MPAKCLTFLFIRLTDPQHKIKTAQREWKRERETRILYGESGRQTDNDSMRVKQRGGESGIGAEKERAVIWSCFGSPLWLGSRWVGATLLPMWANICQCMPIWASACCPHHSFERNRKKSRPCVFFTVWCSRDFKFLWNTIWLGGDTEERTTVRQRRKEGRGGQVKSKQPASHVREADLWIVRASSARSEHPESYFSPSSSTVLS